jgi:hypothetical protein
MPGEFMPPEPAPTGDDGPAREPEAAGPPEPSPPNSPAPGTAPADAGAAPPDAGAAPPDAGAPPPDAGAPPDGAWAPAEVLDPAREVGAVAPTDQGAEVPPGAPGVPPDPAAVTGPPWPRLVAEEGSYTPPRLARWPIVVGILLFAGWVATLVIVPATVSSPSSGYALTATDAHFTATFPARPHHAARAVGTATVIAYTTVLPSHAVGVTYVSLPPSASFSLNAGINGAAQSLPGARIVSRNSLTYLGQPAEDATISSSAGLAQVRVVRFGSSAYVLQAFGPSAASYAHDYNVLLDTFRPQNP